MAAKGLKFTQGTRVVQPAIRDGKNPLQRSHDEIDAWVSTLENFAMSCIDAQQMDAAVEWEMRAVDLRLARDIVEAILTEPARSDLARNWVKQLRAEKKKKGHP